LEKKISAGFHVPRFWNNLIGSHSVFRMQIAGIPGGYRRVNLANLRRPGGGEAKEVNNKLCLLRYDQLE
jgi:hypothetical protein